MTAVASGQLATSNRLPQLLASPEAGLDAHLASFGPLPRVSGEQIVSVTAAGGLTGRGGAGFPLANKLRSVASRRAPVTVANGTEGEPLSSKDAYLLTRAPHLVLDGLVLAARAVGSREAYVATAQAAHANAVRRAIRDRGRQRVRIHVRECLGGFVAGEESALVSQLSGGPPLPADRLVRVYEHGLRGRPTLVSNVETLAHLALLARFGPDWFRSLGTSAEPGSMLTTLSGSVAAPGVLEVPIGARLSDLLDAAGANRVQAVLVGGFHGGWVPADALDSTYLSRASLRRYDATPGAGVVAALGHGECPLATAATVTAYLAGQSARQCGPCVNGLPRLADTLSRLAACDRTPGLAGEVLRLQGLVQGRGACAHPDGTARFVRSTMTVFANEVDAHLNGRCRAPAAH